MAEQPVEGTKENQEKENRLPRVQKGKKKLVLLAGGLFLLLVTMGSILFFFPSIIPAGINPFHKDASTEAKKPEPLKQGHIYSLDAMIVNLADTEFSRFLKIKINFESEEAKPSEEFDKHLPQVKDAILTILTGRTFAEISDSKGKGKLKEEILLKTNQLFEQFKLKTVYFTEFVVQ